jgi:hypothetical protein
MVRMSSTVYIHYRWERVIVNMGRGKKEREE